MGFYGDDILTEGILFHSKEAKELKKQIKEIVKSVNGNDKFLTRLKQNAKASKPSETKLALLKNKITRLFDKSSCTDPVIKIRTYYINVGSITYMITEEYYCLVWMCQKGNLILRLEQSMRGSGFYEPSITDIVLNPNADSSKSLTVEDFKNFIDFCNKYNYLGFTFGTLGSPKSVRFIDEYYNASVSRIKSTIKDFTAEYNDQYNIKNTGLLIVDGFKVSKIKKGE